MSLPTPYYDRDGITLYCGDCREIMPQLRADVVIADPPYGETNLAWDRWVSNWPSHARGVASSLWCFGSMAMLEGEREQYRQRLLRRIAARARRERDFDDVQERCACGDPGACPPCSYCERGSREA